MNIKSLISVAAGGFLGGICRDIISNHWHTIGTLIVNLIGCFLLAFLTYYVTERGFFSGWLNLGLGTGFVGAFTTFSTLTVVVIHLSDNHLGLAFLYLFINAIGGLLMAFFGYVMGIRLGGSKKHA